MSKAIHTTIIATFFTIISFGQKAEQALSIFSEKFPVEKVYIHLDKEIYSPGETVWFKAYLYHDNKPSGLSTNFFLLLMNNKGDVISSKKYPVISAAVKGNIDLPDSLPPGSYYIKAVTPAILNYEEPVIYTKKLIVAGPSAVSSAVRPAQNISLQFFPESGHLVGGISTVIAFKATDQWNDPMEVKGKIKTEDGINIISFSSYHDGIGKIQFRPAAGKKYFAEVETPAGASKKIFTLPVVMESGINLKIQDEKNGKIFQVERSVNNKEQYDTLILVMTINDRVVYENEISFDEHPSAIGHFITDGLPSGILYFTVFDKNRMPLAERLSFVDNGEYRSESGMTIIKKGLSKKEENIIDISFADEKERSFSVSVIDPGSANNNNRENIYSGLLLTSDLRGYIYYPGWYFEKKNDSTALALDNLMLTHGWSRFNWTKILAANFQQKKQAEDHYINISGMVLSEKQKAVDEGSLKVFISAEDSSLYVYQVAVNKYGRFIIDSLVFAGESKIYYTYADKKGNERPAEIITDSTGFNVAFTGKYSFASEIFLAGYSDPVKMGPETLIIKTGDPEHKVLENVVVRSTVKLPVDIINEKYTSMIFRTGGKIKIDNINNPPVDKAMNGVDFVLNRITTIMVQAGTFVNKRNFSIQDHRGADLNRQLKYGFKPAGAMRFWEMGLFINEMPAEIEHLRSLRADQIAMVKMFEAGAIGTGSAYPGGALVVYVNYEPGVVKEEKKTAKYIAYSGYSVTKEFYNPDYTTPADRQQADNRTTLFWNPDMYTDGQSKSIQVKFFNNDFSKRFRIIVEGFDVNGRLIHLDKIIGE